MINMLLKALFPLFWAPIFVQAQTGNVSLPDGQRPITNPYIYEVTSQQGEKSYLLGTFHHGIGVEQLPYWVRRLHQNAELHAYEVMGINFEYFKIFQDMKLKPAESAKALGLQPGNSEFSEEEIQKLVATGIPRPFAVAMSNGSCSRFIYRAHYFGQTFESLDYELMLYSLKFNRPILELEDDVIRERAEKLDPPSSECEVKNLIANDESIAWIDRSMKDFMEDFFSGLELSDDQYDEEDASMFYRNMTWMEKLVPTLNSKRTFIAVGYLHLYGRLGLIKLLRNKGFTVKRVTSDPGDAPGANHDFQR